MEKKKDNPAWLETLYNINPCLAEKAQKDVDRWKEIEQNNLLKQIKHSNN